MKRTILFIILSVFTLSSFADFKFKVNATQDNMDGWMQMDYSDTENYVYVVYRKIDPVLSDNVKYSSITLSGYNKKTGKKDYDGAWAYWRSAYLGIKSSGINHEGRYYTCTTYKNAEYTHDGTTHNAIVEIYYFPKVKIYNVCIGIVNNYTGRIIQRLWFRN